MGSGSKSSKALGRARQRQNTYSNNLDDYSDVDSRTTAMSDEDKRIVNGWRANGGNEFGYFQTANAFAINRALRKASEQGISVEDALRQGSFLSSERRVAGNLKTIETMDKNMKPTNKDMKVVRLTDSTYMDKIVNGAVKSGALSEDVASNVRDFTRGFKSLSSNDIQALKSALVGLKIQEGAFASTTYNTSLSDSAFRDRRVKLDMDIKAGTRGLFSPTGQESEFVLSRHEGYTVSDVYVDGKRLVLKTSTR